MTETGKVRIDRWLWAARFFKTRSLATRAVAGGHVYLNDGRVKPAKIVAIGDTLRVRRGEIEYVVTVLALSARRGPAVEARKLYEETASSIEARELLKERRRLLATADMSGPLKRPNKRDRRLIRNFTRKDRK